MSKQPFWQPGVRPEAPSFWRWLIGVQFLGRPIGWTYERYEEWLRAEAAVAVPADPNSED